MTLAQVVAELTPRQRELFRALEEHGGWASPADLGGTSGSHHTHTLRALVAKGIVEKTQTEVFRSGRYRARETVAPTARAQPTEERT